MNETEKEVEVEIEENVDELLLGEMARVFREMSKRSISLEPTIAKIINDNWWELYE